MDEPVLRWGQSIGIRSDSAPEFRPGEPVGVLSSVETQGQQGESVVVEYLVGGERAKVPRGCLESLDTTTWFRKLGCRVVVSEDEAGSYTADIVRLGSDTPATRAYGVADSPDAAIESARRRCFVEQVGSEAERRPKPPLP